MNTTTSRIGRVLSRARQIWPELGYVQRRMFEVQTGVAAPAHRTGARRGLDEPESLVARSHQR
jgi:hypothetical protein